jgi:hypothetical protein
MGMGVLMTVTINLPSPALEKRSSKVAFATRALQIAASELGRCNGNDSSGEIIGQGADGSSNVSLGTWMFDATADAP